MSAHRVGIVVFDGVTMLDVAGPADVLSEAGRFGADYRIELLSPGGRDVRAANGMRVAADASLGDRRTFDTVLVAGGDVVLTRPVDDLAEATAGLAADATVVGSVCTGAFVLAATGLLDGHRATTHWRHATELARRHPAVTVEPDRIFVRDGRLATSAGVSAGIDLALALLEADQGAELARAVARSLVLVMQRSGGQSQFSTSLTGPAPRSSPVRAVVDAVVADPAGTHGLDELAALSGVTARHLNRLFRAELGSTAVGYVRRLRVDVAKASLDTGRSVTATAQLAGFGNPEALRRAFVAVLGVSPTEYRRRFLTTGPSAPSGR